MPRKSKNEGIYKRADSPFWWACYSDGRGKATRRSTGVPVAEDPEGLRAAAVRANWRAEKHVEETGEGATFDDLMLLYLRDETPKKRDQRGDICRARALMRVFTGMPLTRIGAAEARGYIAARKAAGVGPASINKEVSLISTATDWARKDLDWDIPNPWKGRHQTEPPPRSRWLTPDEADRLIAEAEKRRKNAPWLADYITLGLNTGMRAGEMLWLEWDRVDLHNNRVRFDAVVGQERTTQKNGKAGTVPLNQGARAALLNRARFRAEHCPGSPWVFCHRNGERLVSIQTSWRIITKAADLEGVRQHDLRRTFGSWLVQAGVGIERVSALLRHSNVSITARVYAHLRPTDLADAASVIDDLRGGNQPKRDPENRALSR